MKINKLQDLLKNDEAFLITGEISRKYLTNFHSTDGFLLIKKDDACFFVDARYFEDAKKQIKSLKVALFESYDDLKKYTEHIKTIIVEKDDITLSRFEFLQKAFEEKDVTFGDAPDREIKNMRSIKSIDEKENLILAQRIAEKALFETLPHIKPGKTEIEIASLLEYNMRKNGADGISFDTIVVSGKKSAVPHGVPDGKVLEKGDFVTIDFGTVKNGYHSDMTRTFVIGQPNEDQKNIYETVLQAQKEAIKKIKPGAKCSDIDLAARNFICKKGYKKYFTHSTGHGVGLEIHENPNISFKNENALQVGNVITVEPGIYIPGKFGVRIEDFGIVSKDGFENFTEFSKELIIL